MSRSVYFHNDEDVADYLSRFNVGKAVSSKQYISTTEGTHLYNPDGQVQIYIEGSSKGHDISEFNENELEVLYERDSTFITINKVYADGQWHILLKEV